MAGTSMDGSSFVCSATLEVLADEEPRPPRWPENRARAFLATLLLEAR